MLKDAVVTRGGNTAMYGPGSKSPSNNKVAHNFFQYKNVYLPEASIGALFTVTVISVDEGLLNIKVTSNIPPCSLTLYIDWLKFTFMAVKQNHKSF